LSSAFFVPVATKPIAGMIHSTLSSMVAANEKTNLISSEIRAAYADGDGKASREYHDSKKQGASEDGHQSGGGLLKPIIFGGLDGILTSFAIVAGAAGGRLPPSSVLILGFSNIFADALAMGVGEFLSSKAENEWILSERDRETWEMENYREGEIQEMIEIYESKGMSHEDAELVIKTMSKYQDFFVDIMMTQELALQVPERDHVQGSMREGLVMFCSFAFFGSLVCCWTIGNCYLQTYLCHSFKASSGLRRHSDAFPVS
jgi:vacuolar iron transporter family protein